MRILYKAITITVLSCLSYYGLAQNVASGLELKVEAQGTVATGDFAPLWMSSNKYGMSSVNNLSAYERVGIMRTEQNDSARNWRLGYGLDIALQQGATSKFFVQQAFASITYKKVRLILGSKEHPMDLKNPELSSGGLSIGINSRPIPQIRGEIDYFSIPGTHQWWKWKMRGSYGMTTDANWQKSFSTGTHRYTGNTLYHEKSIYWKFGKEEYKKVPLTFEIGIQMATQFGGKTFNATGRNVHTPTDIEHAQDANAFWQALICSGSDATDGTEKNVAGNHLGSYNMALAWTAENWMIRAYAERYFEDQSMITFQYGVQDHLLGLEGELPKNPYVSKFLVEHISTRNQSGAIYHDQSANIPDKMNGIDNYYNHQLYTGWQHWGLANGNPLITSPIYNDKAYTDKNHSGDIQFFNNRLKAWHFGFTGDPTPELHWRLLLSITENWGTYRFPLPKKEWQQYYMAELSYTPRWGKGWSGKIAFGYDHGGVLGTSYGNQITIRKTFRLIK